MILYPHQLTPLTLVCPATVSTGQNVNVTLTADGKTLLATSLTAETEPLTSAVIVRVYQADTMVREYLTATEKPAATIVATVGAETHDLGTVFQNLRPITNSLRAETDMPARFLCRYARTATKTTHPGAVELLHFYQPNTEGNDNPVLTVGFESGERAEILLPCNEAEQLDIIEVNVTPEDAEDPEEVTCSNALLKAAISVIPETIYTCTDGRLRRLTLTPLLNYIHYHNLRADSVADATELPAPVLIDITEQPVTLSPTKVSYLSVAMGARVASYNILPHSLEQLPLTMQYTSPHGLPDTMHTVLPAVYLSEADTTYALQANTDGTTTYRATTATLTQTLTLRTQPLRSREEMKQAADLMETLPRKIILRQPPADPLQQEITAETILQRTSIKLSGGAAYSAQLLELTVRAADPAADLATFALRPRRTPQFTEEYTDPFE